MEDETLLARWSRLKRVAARADGASVPSAAPATAGGADAIVSASSPAAPPTALTELPPIEGLDFASDFSAFLQPRIEEGLRRAALKKLFHSEHFNQMDGLDVYIGDYNTFEPIPEDMLRELTHARDLLFGDETPAPEPTADAVDSSASAADADRPAGAAPPCDATVAAEIAATDPPRQS